MQNNNFIKLGDIFESIIGGGTPSREDETYWQDGSIPWCTVKDFKNSVTLTETQEFITKLGLKNSSAKIIPKNSLIIPTRMGVGRIAVNKIDMAINQDLKGCIIKETYDLEYVKYAYIQKAKYIESLGSGSTVSGIDLNELKNIKIKSIAYEQQVKIGKLLSSMDKLIEYTTGQSKNIENKKSFMLNKIFNSKFEFEYFELGDIADIKTGYTPPTVDEENFDGPYTWFGVVDMKKKYISKSNRTLTQKSYKESKLIPKNRLLMSFKLTVGKLAFNSVDCFTNEAIANFKFKENILDEYMYYALENSDISSYGSQAAQGITLNNQSLKTIIVPITGIDNQKHISNILLELDNLKELYKQYSDELKNIKKYNLNKIFQ